MFRQKRVSTLHICIGALAGVVSVVIVTIGISLFFLETHKKVDERNQHKMDRISLMIGLLDLIPYGIIIFAMIFDVQLGIFATPTTLGSTYVPVLIPLIIFGGINSYRNGFIHCTYLSRLPKINPLYRRSSTMNDAQLPPRPRY
uniref:G_PROTEIN_RECEP_F1_2 domain-containing protein n=1 Tax=Heterorhabditis bacteriophora TaxID=37862 RepID=A0A1I7WN11_HETBA